MAINFNNMLGLHEHALEIRAKRSELLANNLANADTPGFKARDLDFSKALDNAVSSRRVGLTRTHDSHFSGGSADTQYSVGYRVPLQPDTGDGNTVDSLREQSSFAENSLRYQASLTFLNGRFTGTMKALRGE